MLYGFAVIGTFRNKFWEARALSKVNVIVKRSYKISERNFVCRDQSIFPNLIPKEHKDFYFELKERILPILFPKKKHLDLS